MGKTATQIHAARFEQVTRAGVLADASITGAVRRQILDAAKAVVLYANVGETEHAVTLAEELVASADGDDRRQKPMQRSLHLLQSTTRTRSK